MSLPRLHWRALAPSSVPSNAIDVILDEIADDFEAVAYQNAAYGTRTPGSDKAWTVERIQDTGTTIALGLTPPSGDVDGLRIIIAGHASAQTPTMLTPDAFATNALHIAVVKGATGTIGDWESATPYSGGTLSGYWSAWRATTALTFDSIRVYESEEAIAITGHSTTTGCLIMAGALFDPESTDGSAAESDGRLYGMHCSGLNVVIHATGWSGQGSGGVNIQSILGHGTGVGSNHTGRFNPGASTWATGSRYALRDGMATERLTNGTSIIAMPITTPLGGQTVRVREAFIAPDAINGQVLYEEVTPGTKVERGYIISTSVAAPFDAMLLTT